MCTFTPLLGLSLEEVHPLKQGLKLDPMPPIARRCLLEEVHPLKQGLKQMSGGGGGGQPKT